jgi:murein DD-endopeptidase MepM/ murein hydrolase activator NlpD
MEKFRSRLSEVASLLAVGAGLFVAGCKSAPIAPPSELEVQRRQDTIDAESVIDSFRAVAAFPGSGTRSGGIARLDVWVPVSFAGTAAGLALDAEVFGNRLQFYPVKSPRETVLGYSALVPVPFDAKPSELPVAVRVRRMDQESLVLDSRLRVISANYPSETLTVDPRHVKPDPKAIRRILREKTILGKVYRSGVREKLWDGPFEHPVSSIPTSEFGIRRVYNGQMQSYHQGKDYRAAIGTPVLASGAGRVAFADDLYMTGNTVILDHGLGLFTIYAHLSALQVKEGKLVPRGALLGLSGMTGRASGPHLHFGVNLNRLKVDPNDLLRVAR